MTVSPPITLTTDFGAHDSYVAQMKGVILGLLPEARIVDLCHEVPAQDIAAGAFILETGYAAFPAGAIHVAVVDPGVGTTRRGLVARTTRHTFVAPDNGLLARVLGKEPPLAVHALTEPRYRRESRAATFDGRDLFAPAAAWLARGVPPDAFGPAVDDWVRPQSGAPELDAGRKASVPVLVIDHFGNVTLDVSRDQLEAWSGRDPRPGCGLRLRTREGVQIDRMVRTFSDAAGAGPVMLINSAGYLEVVVDRGRADRLPGLVRGARVELETV